jgi:hypothetical protein
MLRAALYLRERVQSGSIPVRGMMRTRTRIILISYFLSFAFLVLWVPWDIERTINSVTFHGPTYFGWVWAGATPRQRDGKLLAGTFGAFWIDELDEFVDARRGNRDARADGWNFQNTKQYMHVAWTKVIAELFALTAFTCAVLLWLRPRSVNRQS